MTFWSSGHVFNTTYTAYSSRAIECAVIFLGEGVVWMVLHTKTFVSKGNIFFTIRNRPNIDAKSDPTPGALLCASASEEFPFETLVNATFQRSALVA